MGNDYSQLPGIDLDERAIELTDHWTLFSAILNTPGAATKLTVFQGEPVVQGQLWQNITPLEKASKNLMLHRHPCILKYVSSWKRGSGHFLAVESAKPLSISLPSQGGIQICLGLRNILRALIFLHEQAHSCHNNVNISCIYITSDGSWKLGGLEYLCKKSELTQSYMDKSRPYRYNKAIDPNESKHNGKSADQYAFAVLVEEVLRTQNNDDVPSVGQFKEFCSTQLKHPDPDLRPTLSAVLLHPFFTHDFLSVHQFLSELPLKNSEEKLVFFNGLLERLQEFDENIVASQLAALLISRMVLLDPTAQSQLLPYVLRPKDENNVNNLFSESVFRSHLIPKLKHVFCVRDLQIRKVLLSHFNYYIHMFNADDLQEHILPELLVGIKDTDDNLVSITLHCLANLVPHLGAATVIGGHREKLFTDGRPNHNNQNRGDIYKNSKGLKYSASIKKVAESDPSIVIPMSKIEDNLSDRIVRIKQDDDGLGNSFILTERPSPDGGEDMKTSSEHEDFENDEWSDWDNEENKNNITGHEHNDHVVTDTIISSKVLKESADDITSTGETAMTAASTNTAINSNNRPIQKLTDITELDIKNQKMPKGSLSSDIEIDFFQDMEPVIAKTNLYFIDDEKSKIPVINTDDVAKKFAIENNATDEGWGDDMSDWGDE